jgi:hypothetical protein
MYRIDTNTARRLCNNLCGKPLPARRIRDKKKINVYLIDLKDALVAHDERGLMLEALTSVFWIGAARCFSVTDRADIERGGLQARLRQDEAALASVGIELLGWQ